MGTLPSDGSGKPVQGLWDASGHQVVAEQAGTVLIDPVTGTPYAAPAGSSGGGGGASVGTDGATAPTSANELGAIDGSGNLQPLQADGSHNLKVVEANSAAEKTDLDGIKSDLDAMSAAEATAANQATGNTALAGIKSDADTLVTTEAAEKIDMDTLAGAVSGGKVATKAGTGDIVDLATLLTAINTYLVSLGQITDPAWAGGSNAGSEIAILKQIGTQLANQIVQSIGYGWNGGSPTGQNYDMLASIEAFGTIGSATISSINAGLMQLTISSGSLTTLKPGAEIWTDNGSGGNKEKLIVSTAWNGATPIQVVSTPAQTANTRVQWNAPAVGGSGQNLILGMNLPAFMQYVYDNANGGPRLMQGDATGHIVESNSAAIAASVAAGATASAQTTAQTSLTTIAGAISSAKMATKAASGDFVAGAITDLATLLTLAGTSADANTVASLMGRLTKIRDLLAATLTVQGTITEANSAAIAASVAAGATAANQTTANTNTANAATVLGGVADAAATDTTSSWSIKALLAGMFGSMRTLAAAVTSNIIQVKLNGGTANVGNIVVQTVSGTALQADQTNTILKTSLYVKSTTAGDTVLPLAQATMAASLPVTMASDQTPKTSATATRTNVTAAAADTSLLASNASRKGAIFFNDSTAILYLAYGSGAASTTSYTVQVAGGGYFEVPSEPIYTGAIRGYWSAANGTVRISELS